MAAYSHPKSIDIRRQYNPTTGEQINVIEENTVDRPWFERQFIRAPIGQKNLSTDNYELDTLSQLGVYGGVTTSLPRLRRRDRPQPRKDAPHIDTATGYPDITNKAFARPLMVTIERWGFTFPACF